jgi:hypothetical protein
VRVWLWERGSRFRGKETDKNKVRNIALGKPIHPFLFVQVVGIFIYVRNIFPVDLFWLRYVAPMSDEGNDQLRVAAAIKIQSQYRRRLAVLFVNARRILLWSKNRNSLKIQLFWKQAVARAVVKPMAIERRLQRWLREERRIQARVEALEETLKWRGGKCIAAASLIQRWYMARKFGLVGTLSKNMFNHLVRGAAGRSNVVRAHDEQLRLFYREGVDDTFVEGQAKVDFSKNRTRLIKAAN